MKSITKHAVTISFVLPLLLSVGYAQDADQEENAELKQGRQLHRENCVRCHDALLYTKKNRRVGSLPALESQVEFCATNLRLQWFDEEIDAVSAYLNRTFYHF
uniref:Cytochrome c, mono- and diheme variants n=1 Tax=Candidatus Kentrum sp. DK TaxID=2126562 RepID=A0A450S7Q7_9GAMM|nr:MAG: Cytochrome c, mono- and diheme variants [Candidatus Kentron sp. DK]VFJ59951.1 MAG: Cytochrome c, mono- and diheme variants [Candidatus Kentron sp. DK]